MPKRIYNRKPAVVAEKSTVAKSIIEDSAKKLRKYFASKPAVDPPFKSVPTLAERRATTLRNKLQSERMKKLWQERREAKIEKGLSSLVEAVNKIPAASPASVGAWTDVTESTANSEGNYVFLYNPGINDSGRGVFSVPAIAIDSSAEVATPSPRMAILDHLTYNIGSAVQLLWSVDAKLSDLEAAQQFILREIKRLQGSESASTPRSYSANSSILPPPPSLPASPNSTTYHAQSGWQEAQTSYGINIPDSSSLVLCPCGNVPLEPMSAALEMGVAYD